MKATSEEAFRTRQNKVHHEQQKTVPFLSGNGLSDHLIFLASVISLIWYSTIHLKRSHSPLQAKP